MRLSQLRRTDALRREKFAVRDMLSMRLADVEDAARKGGQGQAAGSGSLRHRLLMRPLSDEEELAGGEYEQQHAKEIAEMLREEVLGSIRPRYMMAPHTLARKLWDTAALLLIYATLVTVPLQIAFYTQNSCTRGSQSSFSGGAEASDKSSFWDVFSFFVSAFFFLDVVLNFFTGYYDEEEQRVDYSLRRIALQYATSYLLTDVLACLPINCIMVLANSSLNYYNTGELIKLVRIFGIGRRGHGSPWQWIDHFSGIRREFSHNARRMLSFALVLLETCHCCACLLWLTLRIQDFPADTWPVLLDLLEAPVGQQWIFSLFSIVSAMIGLGYGSYPPITWPEAMVWVFVMILVAAMFAVMNGFIINYIFQSSSGAQEYKDRMDRMVEMLQARHVPSQLRRRVLDFMAAKHSEGRVDHDEEVLRELPPAIRSQVALLSVSDLLARLPPFADSPLLLEDVAPLLRRTVALPGQVILQEGHLLRAAYFLRSGFVDVSAPGAVDTLGPGDCLAELALLPAPPAPSKEDPSAAVRDELVVGSRWRAAFTATALSRCELFYLPAAEFHAVLRDHPEEAEHLMEQAQSFLERVARANAAKGQQSPSSGEGGAERDVEAGPGNSNTFSSLRLGQVVHTVNSGRQAAARWRRAAGPGNQRRG